MRIEIRCGGQNRKCGRLLMVATDESGSWVFEPHAKSDPIRIIQRRNLETGVGPDMSDDGIEAMHATLRCPKHKVNPRCDLLPLLQGTEPEGQSSPIRGGKVTFV